jgi:hypothetical protein
MKRSQVLLMLIFAIILLTVWGCGGNANQPTSGTKKIYRPDWWNTQPSETHICSYGQAEKVSETASMDAAKANALLEAAQYVEINVKGMIKNYEEEAGVKDPQVLALSQKVVKAVSNARFSNVVPGKTETIIVTTKDGERYKTFIQLMIPKTEVNKNMANQIRNEEALYNQFKASQAFQELDDNTK